MADLSITTKVASPNSDYRWLRSRHGRDNAVTATIDVSKLVSGTDYDSNGVVPSGLALGKVTGADSYGPYDPAATDGRQYLAGFLLEPQQLQASFTTLTTTNLIAPMLVHGIIDPAFVPNTPTLDTSIPTTGQFVFYGVDYKAVA